MSSNLEGEGEEVSDALEEAHAAFGEVAEDTEGVLLEALVFGHDLAAGTAGRGFAEGAAGIASDDGKRLVVTHLGSLRGGGEEGGALGTETRGVGGVLLVGAGDHRAVGKAQGGAHMELGIRGIGRTGSLDGTLEEVAVGGVEEVGGVDLAVVNLEDFFHLRFLFFLFPITGNR